MEIRRKDIMRIIMIIVYLIFTVSGLILMKKGGNAGKITMGSGEFAFSMSWISALGFICYIISFLLFTRIIMMFENVSYISPICNGIAQACIVISSIIFWSYPSGNSRDTADGRRSSYFFLTCSL